MAHNYKKRTKPKNNLPANVDSSTDKKNRKIIRYSLITFSLALFLFAVFINMRVAQHMLHKQKHHKTHKTK